MKRLGKAGLPLAVLLFDAFDPLFISIKKSPRKRGFLKLQAYLNFDFFVVFCFPSDGRLVVFKDWIDPGFA